MCACAREHVCVCSVCSFGIGALSRLHNRHYSLENHCADKLFLCALVLKLKSNVVVDSCEKAHLGRIDLRVAGNQAGDRIVGADGRGFEVLDLWAVNR